MNHAGVCWYLSGLFAVALAVTSAMSFHPDARSEAWLLMGSDAGLSIVFALLAVGYRLKRLPSPRWLLRVFQCLAVLGTIVVLMMVGG
jgi:hypothetical protein